MYKPKEEGLDNLEIERKVTCYRIHLSLKDLKDKQKEPGFQAPLEKSEVIPENGPEEQEPRR